MKDLFFDKIQIHSLSEAFTQNKNKIDVLRLDALHPIISGNKFFKLRYYIDLAIKENKTIQTFGGYYSNHIVATAFTCLQNKINCIGVIRGEEPLKLSHTLKEALKYGMQLKFTSRKIYDELKNTSFSDNNTLIIPEGGAGAFGVNGAATINNHYEQNYDYLVIAVGTGTTLAGISQNTNAKIVGINVLKGNENQTMAFINNFSPKTSINLVTDFHFNGYAKKNENLLQFMNELFVTEKVETDFVYTGKMFYALKKLVDQNYFPLNSSILAIHTGGLQGNNSLPKGALLF